jgi:hypothetical protein
VKEQSHKDEMSAALRGDFQRLRARGVAAALVPQEHEEADGDELPASEETRRRVPDEPVPAAVESAPDEPVPAAAESAPDEPGWLTRLLGR